MCGENEKYTYLGLRLRHAPCRPRPRRAVYWWSEEISSLHQAAQETRRALKRARCCRGANPAEISGRVGAHREATRALRCAIARAKATVWEELLLSLDDNPWGRPYLIVREKLRHWAPPYTESMEAPFLDTVLGTLFPAPAGGASPGAEPPPAPGGGWSEEYGVSEEELAGAVRRMRQRNRAPGPDGVPGKAWALAFRLVGNRLRRLFSECLREGKFPPVWRRAKLVLLRKGSKPADVPADMPTGRGDQAARKSNSWPTRPASGAGGS